MASAPHTTGDLFNLDFSEEADVTLGESPGLRVIHSADWHLGKTLDGLSREKEHSRFLEFLAETIRQKNVDLLIIAGDVFDSSNPPHSSLQLYYQFLSRVHSESKCSVVVIAGNHDSPALIDAPKDILGSLRVRVIGALPDKIEDVIVPVPNGETPQAFVAAVPFLRERDVRKGRGGQSAAEIREDLCNGIKACYENAANALSENPMPVIATGHLTVAGASSSDSEREIHIGGLGSVDASIFPDQFDYVALGHLHRPQLVGGDDRIRYSGSPIPLSFSEASDQKELRLVHFDDSGNLVGTDGIPIPPSRRLLQLKTTRAELIQDLEKIGKRKEEFRTWVEVVVTDAIPGEALFEQVQEAVGDDASFRVIKVIGNHGTARLSLSDSGFDSNEEWENALLEQPKEVFRLRLEKEDGLTDEERAEAELTFSELVGLYHESNRSEEQAK